MRRYSESTDHFDIPRVGTKPHHRLSSPALGGLPTWITNGNISGLPRSTWKFTNSEGVEVDALVFAFGKGSFFLTDLNDPDGIVHEILYVGLGNSTSKGPIPFGLGASISNLDLRNGGVIFDPWGVPPKAREFGPFGAIISGQIGGPGFGMSGSMVVLGLPRARAVGFIYSEQFSLPGIGFTIMSCIFAVDP